MNWVIYTQGTRVSGCVDSKETLAYVLEGERTGYLEGRILTALTICLMYIFFGLGLM